MSAPILLSSAEALTAKHFKVVRERFSLPEGRGEIERTSIHHPGAAVILPQLPNGNLIILRQYRYALREEILEFAAGTLEPGEDPSVCARREVIEETGYAANELISLGSFWSAPGIGNEKLHAFLARDLQPASAPRDEDELISVLEASPQQIEEMIAQGALLDAKSLSCFLLAKLKGYL